MTSLPELITDPDTLEAGKTIFQWAAKTFGNSLFKGSKGKGEKGWEKGEGAQNKDHERN